MEKPESTSKGWILLFYGSGSKTGMSAFTITVAVSVVFGAEQANKEADAIKQKNNFFMIFLVEF